MGTYGGSTSDAAFDLGTFDVALFDKGTSRYLLGKNNAHLDVPILSISTRCSLDALAGSFTIDVPNPNNVYTNTFAQNDDIVVGITSIGGFYDSTIRGYIDKIERNVAGNANIIRISGQDYTARLNQRNANDTFTSVEASTILTNPSTGLMRYFPDITTNEVDVTTTTTSIDYVEKPVFDCIKELAAQTGYDFYVDVFKDLHFEIRNKTSSGNTYSTANGTVLDYDFDYDTKKIYTVVKVFGGLVESAAYSDPKVGDAATVAWALSYKPKRNSAVVTVAAVPKVEGTDYTIDYDNHTIIFSTAPGAAAAVAITYTALQKVFTQKSNNVASYGSRTLVVTDLNILSSARAIEVANLNLALYSDPRTVGKVYIQLDPRLRVGQTCIVHIPMIDITSTSYTIIEINHSLGSNGFKTELVLANSEIVSIPEALAKIQAELNEVKMRTISKDSSMYVVNADDEKATFSATQYVKGDALSIFWWNWDVCTWSQSKWGEQASTWGIIYENNTTA